MSGRNPYAGSRCSANDLHEILRKEVYKPSTQEDNGYQFFTNKQSTVQTESGVPPNVVGFEDYGIYVDSTQRDTHSDYSVGEINWNIVILNNNLTLKNVVAVQLEPFYFPKIYNPTGFPEFFYHRRVFIEMRNAPSNQGFLGSGGNKYHWEMDVQNIDGQAVRLVPVRETATFFFSRPIPEISDMQFKFTVPPMSSVLNAQWQRVPIPQDTIQVAVVPFSNPLQLTVQAPLSTDTFGPIGTPSSPGIAIAIRGLVSNDPTVDALINTNTGIFVTTINSTTTITVAGINAATVNAAYIATAYIPKNRIAMGIRFTSINTRMTNYVSVVHS